MNDDLLKAATRALREEHDDADDKRAFDGRFTRGRVMASVHQRTLKRRTRLSFLLPMAACLAAASAWGAQSGQLPRALAAIAKAVGFEPAASAAGKSGPRASVVRPTALASEVAAPAAAPAEPLLEPPVPVPSAVEVAAATLPARSTPPPSSAGRAARAAFSDSDGDLYRLAHEAHFVERNYAAALSGWNRYLERAPNGRLGAEARYNRALCLVHLGRDAEARTALAPFAAESSSYRKSEARALLHELDAAP